MVLNSYSKINLTLKINSKQKKGLHNIQSFFCLINLKDIIKIKKTNGKKDKVNFKGPFAKHVNKNNNTIKSLLVFLRKLKLISSYYSIIVEKKIPVFAGLGGGTSNAVSVMKHVLNEKPKKKIFNMIEKKIGSDFKLFFYKQGFLKKLDSIKSQEKRHKYYFVLVKPPIKCSTREIYSKVKNYSEKDFYNKIKIKRREDFLNFLSNNRNDLQKVVEKKYPNIKIILDNISFQKGCYFSRMTGSGSVCYGLFIKQNYAKKAFNNLKNKYPKLWVSLAKTV
tara:strand:+ start:2890 stop:3726 length:837 start_codon:yes stop_codon:yes gene_type:complete